MNTAFEAQCRADTPLGPLTLVATARGLAAAWFDAQSHHPGDLPLPTQPGHPHLAMAAREFAAYFDGRTPACSIRFSVPLDPQGTPFQQQVWQALLGIAPGALSSYGAIAQQLGRPAASRAVGAAVGRNPIAVIVPCHRVVGSSGALTGYAGGLHRKQALLQREGSLGLAPHRRLRPWNAEDAVHQRRGDTVPAAADLAGSPLPR